jgi:methylmalonyl-CoA mutase N-terminal domain/subunit
LSKSQAHTTWIQRELSGEGDGRRWNQQIRYLLEHGQTGIDVIGDSPTQSLLNPDHPLAREAVGTQGVSRWLILDLASPLIKRPIAETQPPKFS